MPIEIASRDEIAALQLERMKWSLKHAYSNVAALQKGVRHGGRASRRSERHSTDLRKFPFTAKDDLRANYPFGMFAVPRDKIVRIHASSGTTGKPTVVGYSRRDIDTWADVMRAQHARRRRPARHAGAQRLRLRAVHRRLGFHYGAERLGMTVVPVSGGMTERQVQADRRFQARHHHRDAELHAGDPRRIPRAGRRSARNRSLKIGMFGAEPWTNAMRDRDRGRFRHACDRQLRPVGGDRAGRRLRMHRDQGRPAHLGGSFLSGGDRSGDRRGAARWRAGRAGVHLAHQGGDAGHPLSHARSVAPAARHGALDAADGEDHRPLPTT